MNRLPIVLALTASIFSASAFAGEANVQKIKEICQKNLETFNGSAFLTKAECLANGGTITAVGFSAITAEGTMLFCTYDKASTDLANALDFEKSCQVSD